MIWQKESNEGVIDVWKEAVQKLFGQEVEPQFRRVVDEELARQAHLPRMLQFIGHGLTQAVMLGIFLSLPGGPFKHFRRAGYVSLYFLLMASALVCGIFLHLGRNKSAAYKNRLQTIYAAIAGVWSCGICLLDQMGNGNVTVFCYMLPGIAALSMLSLKRSVMLLSGAEILLMILLLAIPGGEEENFSSIVNSLCTTATAILIAGWHYNARSQAIYKSLVLEKHVVTDAMTGLFNRRYMDTELKAALEERTDAHITAGIMMDVDLFKAFNDNAGHRAGDECLEKIGAKIREMIENQPIRAIRYGGEEFFLCFLENGRMAEELAERLRVEIEQMDIGRPYGRQVTISAGVYAARGKTELETLIRHADAALYRAKNDGRNQVVVSDQSLECQ